MWKRNRVLRSSSAGEIGFTQFRPIDSPVAYWGVKRPAPGRSVHETAPVKNRKQLVLESATSDNKEGGAFPCVFTIGSADDAETVPKRICGEEFLQNCFLCKKKLKAKDDLFMYGCLGAFRSPDCRDCQMAIDGFEKQVSRGSATIVRARNLNKKDTAGQWFGNKQQNPV